MEILQMFTDLKHHTLKFLQTILFVALVHFLKFTKAVW